MQFDERRHRPLTTADLFDEAFDLYKRNFVLFLSIVAFVVVPTTIFDDVYALKMMNAMVSRMTSNGFNSNPGLAISYLASFLKQSVISYLIALVPWTLAFLALTSAVSARYLEQPTSLITAYKSGLKRIVPGVIATALFSLMAFIGTFISGMATVLPDQAALFIVVGLLLELVVGTIAIAKYSLYMGVVVNEKLGPIKSLKRSGILTSGDTGRILWTIICLTFLNVVIAALLETVLSVFTGQIVATTYLIIPMLKDNAVVADQLATGLAYMILIPFFIVVLNLLYFDQRIRKEGYDMEVLADRLGYHPIPVTVQAAYAPALSAPVVKNKSRKK
jgi:hypothetical protein